MERLKYVLLVLLLIFLIGPKGCPYVNLHNNLQWEGGSGLTAKLVCPSITFQAYTGQYSNCKIVLSEMCNCDLYLDNEPYGYFQGCIDPGGACQGDATILLTLDESDQPFIYVVCIDRCGEDIFEVGDFIDREAILDFIPTLEGDQEKLDLYFDY